jgi:ketol-acid reductoisomerase
MAKLNFGGTEENVVTREEFPLAKAQEVLKDEVVAVIGYGVQGPGQALNQKENGVNVIVGQRKNSKSWDKAVNDGFVPGETLFEIEEALEKGTIICYLLTYFEDILASTPLGDRRGVVYGNFTKYLGFRFEDRM